MEAHEALLCSGTCLGDGIRMVTKHQGKEVREHGLLLFAPILLSSIHGLDYIPDGSRGSLPETFLFLLYSLKGVVKEWFEGKGRHGSLTKLGELIISLPSGQVRHGEERERNDPHS